MPVVVYRQPWFWAVVVAVVAILGFVVVIGASSRDHAADGSTTIVQQPSTTPSPAVVPVPVPSVTTPSTPSTPVQPVAPARPADPAKPAQPAKPVVVKERIIVKEKPVPVPVPAPTSPDEFGNTGMARVQRFQDQNWKANGTMDMDQTDLKSAGISESSTELFTESTANEPYTVLYAPIPDQAGKYVRYAPQH